MAEFQQLPRRVRFVVENVRAGQFLCRSYRVKSNGEFVESFFYEPSGKPAPEISSREAIASGFLRPRGDGLFSDTSQTFEAT
jgi:hypothetical protein